jgi:NTE family protein
LSAKPAQTIGTSRRNLVEPCGDHPGRTHPQRPGEDRFALSFSGGGWRAALTAAGALRFMADAGLLDRVGWVSSVSGGSITNGLLAVSYEEIQAAGFAPEAVDHHVLNRILWGVRDHSLTRTLLLGSWRALGPMTRTDVLARTLDRWFFDGRELQVLSDRCLFTFNAANETSGVRFGFDREWIGDYVIGHIATGETTLRVANAVAASASVPGPFAATRLPGLNFPCGSGADVRLLDGGIYDNLGLEAIDDLRGPCLVVVSAGGVLRTGMTGLVSLAPIVRDLRRSSELLYRQATALRVRTMIERFQAWEKAKRDGQSPPDFARQGILFGLASTIDKPDQEWLDLNPVPIFDGERLAEIKTTFSRLPAQLCDHLIYRGWWLTGASLATFHRDLLNELPVWRPLPSGTNVTAGESGTRRRETSG